MNSVKEILEQFQLSIKTVTWQKDSHSLFDYQFNKNVVQKPQFLPLTQKYYFIYRNNESSQVYFRESLDMISKNENDSQLLCGFYLKQEHKKHRLEFYDCEAIKNLQVANTFEYSSISKKEQEIYLIVRSLKTKNNQNKGYKLSPGQIIKLGRVEYLVTSINNNGNQFSAINKSKFWMNNKRIVVGEIPKLNEDNEQVQCKYCMMGQGTELGQFLCTPCKCSGSCGLVHFHCLQKWNQSKVKKQVIGGTIQYNFQKFYCQVCKEEYPRYIQKNNVEYELLPIQKPNGQHLMLEGISEKANNMMVIQNVPEDGIKIGRGHECEIRVTDISVSRNHAKIVKKQNDYYIFDNKSKFGTLVKEQKLILDLSRIKQGIQIGRTVITFEKGKKA